MFYFSFNISQTYWQTAEYKELGLSFEIPIGWTSQVDGDYMFLKHNDISGLMVVLAENSDPNVLPNFYESYLSINLQGRAGTQDYFGVLTPGSNFINFETLSVSENTLEAIGISVYPNPTSGYININSTKTIDKVELSNLLGKRVLQTTQTNQIKINHFANGIYLLKVFANNKSITKKIVKK